MNFDKILDDQRNAPKDMAEIDILCVRPALGERIYPDSIEVDTKKGVIGDRWSKINWVLKDDGTPDERNQISILPKRIYEGICLASPGQFYPGDTIIADIDASFENFPIGQKIQIGETVLEVSDVPNYGCEKWRDRYGMPAWKFIAHKDYQHLRLRGFLCQVVQSGTIHKSDKIRKI